MKKKGTILKGGAAVAVGSAAAVASTANSNMMAMGDDASMEDDDVVAVVNHENIGRHIHHGTAEVVAVENDSTIEVTSPENVPTPMPDDVTQGDMPLMAGNIDTPETIEGDALTADLPADNNTVVDAADAV